MSTLKQVLDAGNDAEGDDIVMSAGDIDMGTAGSTPAGTVFCRGGIIQLDAIASMQANGSGRINYSATEYALNGANFDMNDGSGTGASQFNLDGAEFEIGTAPQGNPTNPTTPSTYWQIKIEGTPYFIPLFQ